MTECSDPNLISPRVSFFVDPFWEPKRLAEYIGDLASAQAYLQCSLSRTALQAGASLPADQGGRPVKHAAARHVRTCAQCDWL